MTAAGAALRAGAATEAPRLSVRRLTAGYGGLAAVRNIDLECRAGEILALIGPNGAGKTTTLGAVVGLVRTMAGHIEVAGRDIKGLPPHRVSRHGVALIPSDRGVFGNLTVAEHLRLALRSRARKNRSGPSWGAEEAIALFPALARRRSARASDLSGGEQQMLAITKAVMLGPGVLLIDELSLGLAPKLVQDILAVIRSIVDQTGMAVVLVEQHYELGLAIADRCVVLTHGEVAFSGDAKEILQQRDRLASVYLAHSSSATAGAEAARP